jgi:DNA-binding ferritin-like protein
MTKRSTARAALAALVLATGGLALASCQSAYYATMEKFGYAKREILVDRVEEAREEQKDAKEQFVSTYERFKALTGVSGGKLEDTYNKLNSSYEDCAEQADEVHEKIQAVEDVADAMFSEWKSEIGQYSDASLKKKSQETLDQTKQRYSELLDAMKRASKSMDPVLTAFRDRVLFLKHNLNAQAIASLQETVVAIQDDVSKLINDMQASITEADEFLGAMKSSG